MRVFLVKAVVSLLGCLPLRMNQQLGATLGWLAWVTHSSLRRNTMLNLAMCFPDWSEAEQLRVGKASLIETGKALTESAWIWRRPTEQLEALIMGVQGEELLARARNEGRGVLMATPHLGTWEFCTLPLSRERPITYLYKSPRASALEPLLIKWRGNLNAWPARLDRNGIKQVLNELRNSGTVGVLPDQEPDRDSGVFAPFFGHSANTMTLLAKLASRGNACVLFCYSERLSKGRGWQIHYVEADRDIADKNKLVAAEALNRSVERCIKMCPTQYLWSYKRFRLLPEGGRRAY